MLLICNNLGKIRDKPTPAWPKDLFSPSPPTPKSPPHQTFPPQLLTQLDLKPHFRSLNLSPPPNKPPQVPRPHPSNVYLTVQSSWLPTPRFGNKYVCQPNPDLTPPPPISQNSPLTQPTTTLPSPSVPPSLSNTWINNLNNLLVAYVIEDKKKP